MTRLISLAPPTIVLMCLTVALPAGQAVAQQKQQVSLKASTEDTKVTGHNVDAGDVPNHIVRVYEVHRTYGSPPIINGLKLVESWERGITDLIDGNGTSTAYIAYVMENGDKLFARAVSVVQGTAGKLSATQVGNLTGGTGKLATIRGSVRGASNFDIRTGFNENQTDIEYAIEK